MGGTSSETALRVLLCVLALLVLVLAALVLGPAWCRASMAKKGIASGAYGGARYGGAIRDVWNTSRERVSTTPWGFTARQTNATPGLNAEWDQVRLNYAALHAALDTAYAADPMSPFKKGAARAGNSRLPGTWWPTYSRLDEVLGAAGLMIDTLRVEPPTAAHISEFARLKAKLGAALGKLAADASLGPAVAVAANAFLAHANALLHPPVGIPALPPLSGNIANCQHGAPGLAVIAGFHGPVTAASVEKFATAYKALYDKWVYDRSRLKPNYDFAKADAALGVLEAGVDAVCAGYTVAATVTQADHLGALVDKAGADYNKLIVLFPKHPALAALLQALKALEPIVPPPFQALPAQLANYNPAIVALSSDNAHNRALVAAFVTEATNLHEWYTSKNTPASSRKIRTLLGLRKRLVNADAAFVALEAAVCGLIDLYTRQRAHAHTNVDTAKKALKAAIERFVAVVNPKDDTFMRLMRLRTAASSLSQPFMPVEDAAQKFESSPLLASQKLIHMAGPPIMSLEVVNTATAATSARSNVLIRAKSAAELDGIVSKLSDAGGRQIYGLVVDGDSDDAALLKAVAINLKATLPGMAKIPPKQGANGWLYVIALLPGGGYTRTLRDYIKPALYAVDG